MKVRCLWMVASYCSFWSWKLLFSSFSVSFTCRTVSSLCWAWRKGDKQDRHVWARCTAPVFSLHIKTRLECVCISPPVQPVACWQCVSSPPAPAWFSSWSLWLRRRWQTRGQHLPAPPQTTQPENTKIHLSSFFLLSKNWFSYMILVYRLAEHTVFTCTACGYTNKKYTKTG